MLDKYQREINYLRISVTDRCNLRCIYCMPPQGVKNVPHQEILSFEEIYQVVLAASLVGIKKVRLTGGEPLVRKGVRALVEKIASVGGVDDLALTTNGILFAANAKELKKAGLKRVNISLDSLYPDRYKYITRGGCLKRVWESIEAALELKMHPVKINTVVVRGFNDDEIVDLAGLSVQKPLHIRFIELMPVGTLKFNAKDYFIPAKKIKNVIEEKLGKLFEVRKLTGSGPARYYKLSGASGTIGFISGVSERFCDQCNRLRLTSTGGLRSCLYNEEELDIKYPLRSGASLEKLIELITLSIQRKPKQSCLFNKKLMSQIGG